MTVGYNMTTLIVLASLICLFQHASADSDTGGLVQQVSPFANRTQYAFGVARNSSVNFTASGRLSLPQDVANVDGWYRHDTDDFVSRSNGLYFLHICVGVRPNSTVSVQQAGGYPRISYQWQSTSHRGVILGCRSGIARLTKGVVVGMNFQGGSIFSDSLLQTSFSAFSVTDAMTSSDGVLFVSSSLQRPFNALGASIPFGCRNTIFLNPIPPEATYNAATYTYKCLTGGYYLVSLSTGINPGQAARVALTNFDDANNIINFELTHNTRETNGLITLSRSVLLNCSADSYLQLTLIDGEIWSGPNSTLCDQNLVSWTVVRYSPVSQAAAWAAYIDHVPQWPADNSSNLVNFNVVTIKEVKYEGGIVTVSYSGTYMVYLSAATSPGQPINLVLMRNDDVIVSLVASETATDGSEMMEHGIIIPLTKNDQLSVAAVDGTTFYSDSGLQVGFWGILIYSI